MPQLLMTQSTLKKNEFYESVAPNFEESPPLQYIEASTFPDEELVGGDSSLLQYLLRSRTSESEMVTEMKIGMYKMKQQEALLANNLLPKFKRGIIHGVCR